MAFEHPQRRQMRGADEPRLVGIGMNRRQVDVGFLGLEEGGGAPDRELANAAVPEASAHRDPFGVPPRLELREAADDVRELLRELLDRALYDARGLGIALGDELVELLLRELL